MTQTLAPTRSTVSTPRNGRRSTRRSGPPVNVAARVCWLVAVGAFAAFFLLPIAWLLLAPTKSDTQIINGNPFSFGSFGTLGHTWRTLFDYQDGAITTWIKNSAIYAVLAVVIALVTSIPAGYALALTKFAGRKTLLTITLVVMIMPATALVLPTYLELNEVQLTGTLWSVVLPLSFYPFGVYLIYIYFSTTVPEDVLASARLDGCSELQVFRLIAVPLAKPVIGLVGFFCFVASWNNFYLPFVMLPSSSQYPAQVGLNDMLSASQIVNPSAGSGLGRPELALATLVTILPVLLVFLFSQRALVSGLMSGASKE